MGFQPGNNDSETGGFGFTRSNANNGLAGRADPVLPTDEAVPNSAGGVGVFGFTKVRKAAGVFGVNDTDEGVGVQGNGPEVGVAGFNNTGTGPGVKGFSEKSTGVLGQSTNGSGLVATSSTGHGLDTFSDNDIAIFAQGGTFSGVFNGALVVNKTPKLKPDPNPAKDIDGSIVINDGNLFLNNGHVIGPKSTITCFDVALSGADCAEEFELSTAKQVQPGSVMSFDQHGMLTLSQKAYDKNVAGVISGAGDYKPGILLDRQRGHGNRAALALVGKACCLVDARLGPIEVGDLLTTSPTPGHAMKATDAKKAFGAVIGKAMRPLVAGVGLVPVLVALR
jgi:hypothetical protein